MRRLKFVSVAVAWVVIAGSPLPVAAVTKPKRRLTTTVRRVPKPAVTTTKSIVKVALPSTTVAMGTKEAVLAGYEKYLQALVAAAKEPSRSSELLPKGMTGDALARQLEIRRIDVTEGLYWDGSRSDIKSSPQVQVIGATSAVLRDCRSIGGVLRKRAGNAPVADSQGVDVDDLRVTLVVVDGQWLVSSADRYNEVEGKSQCAGAPSS